MIEVEKNFDLRPGDKEQLIAGAKFLGTKTYLDAYYDTPDYQLTGQDYWLRTRNGNFELKVPLNSGDPLGRQTDQYEELESDLAIIEKLGLPKNQSLKQSLTERGYAPFATIKTEREKYKKGDFNLDFDVMDFGFETFEVELMVESVAEIKEAEERILTFGQQHQIAATAGHGKAIEYLIRFKPEHYNFLMKQRIVKKHS